MKVYLNGISLLALLLLAGCGYHSPGNDHKWIGEGSGPLYVELFVNRTSEPYLDTIVTSEISAQLAHSRLVALTGQPEAAGLLLSGEIASFTSSAVGYDPDDDISEYRALLKITATLRRRSDSAVLWRGDLSRSETYASRSDKGVQRTGEKLAARTAARRLAEDLMARLLDDF